MFNKRIFCCPFYGRLRQGSEQFDGEKIILPSENRILVVQLLIGNFTDCGIQPYAVGKAL